jgi:nucleoside-diphosphate-sugar epimerase
MPIVFVTGGSGYVGRNLIRALVARGDEVRALARCSIVRALPQRLAARASTRNQTGRSRRGSAAPAS